ncbi:molybdopterin molybdenumtransferase MoeA [Pikeienuella piscinae]|uniref:Molybdopterin molybdenumtransferase n=1 Tax=Pikeienuella piscinae TaxID=2748098 RepID=A0A7L5BV74_9RHOB|nr:molybdopterin-binding protein [Pikeienuella piscinae]QIE55735.1 molybdopterin molybdenumtransferase MoeA [Pikeienuella piscinae]
MDPRRPVNDCFALPPGVDWTPVADALAALKASVATVTGTEEVGIENALGRVLAKDVTARIDQPPAANAAVDGYAFAHESYLQEPLRVVDGRAAAGAPYPRALRPGEALRILTGALLPKGADTVMLDEDARREGALLHGPTGLKPGVNRRRAAENAEKGAVALGAGARLTPQALAHAAAAGLSRLPVRRRLRVGLLSTGDEIREPGAALAPGQIHDANRPMLTGLVRAWGCAPVDLGVAPDNAAAVRAALDAGAAGADVILASGGASAGDEDWLSRLLGAEGSRAIWRIAMKPGRPLALGRWRGAPVFGLPGNPVAAFTCALIFARPALLAMGGAGWAEPAAETRPAAFARRRKAGRREYLRARLDADGRVEVFANEGSGLTRGLVWAEGFVDLPDDGPDVAIGDPVAWLPFSAFGL